MNEISIGTLKKLIRYDPDTGNFFRLIQLSAAGGIGLCPKSYDKDGYTRIHAGGKRYKSHRLAWFYMTGEWPDCEIDHINGIRDDNRFENLRKVSGSENKRNTSIPNTNKSGVMGVCWDTNRQMWKPQIQVEGTTINLGRFLSLFEAVCVRKSAEKKYGFHQNHGKGPSDHNTLKSRSGKNING